MTSPARSVIINADDFGQSPGVNRGIIAAFEKGVVTSTSLMVRWPAAAEAAAYARRHPHLSVGLHLDLGEWAYAPDDSWVALYEVAPLDEPAQLVEEIERQFASFRRMVGRPPSHVDSHQHVHRNEPLRSILISYAAAYQVPLRQCSDEIRYCGDFYGQSDKGYPCPESITAVALISVLRSLEPGITELGCHPGEGADLDSMYVTERSLELGTLCHPHVRQCIDAEGIDLCSFSSLGG